MDQSFMFHGTVSVTCLPERKICQIFQQLYQSGLLLAMIMCDDIIDRAQAEEELR